jgi:hypothetical protein
MHHRNQESTRRGGRPGTLASLVVLGVLVLTLLPTAPGRAAAQEAPATDSDPVTLREDLAFDRFPPVDVLRHWLNGRLSTEGNSELAAGIPIVSHATNRMYQLYEVADVDGQGDFIRRVGLLVRDLTSLEIEAGFLLPSTFTAMSDFADADVATKFGGVRHVVAPELKKIFLWSEIGFDNRRIVAIDETALPAGQKGTTPPGAFTIHQVGVNSTALLTWAGETANGPLRAPPAGDPRQTPLLTFPLQGLTWSHGKIYALFGLEDDSGNIPMWLMQLDPQDMSVDWDRFVRGCRAAFTAQGASNRFGPLNVLRTDGAIFVPCTTSSTAMVVRIPFGADESPAPVDDADDAAGAETAYPGSGNPVSVLVDGGGERIHFRVHNSGSGNASVLTFDAARLAYVGQQAVSRTGLGQVIRMPVGVDASTGRVYVQGARADGFGLSLIDGRTPKTEPPATFLELDHDNATVGVLPRDETHRRLFLFEGNAPLIHRIVPLEDVDPGEVPRRPDPDENTKNVKEEPGLTEASFSSNAAGFGLRVIMPGGFTGVIPERSTRFLDGPRYENAPCHRADRDFTFAVVEQARLTDALQSARAVSARADSTTQLDLALPSRCAIRPGLGRSPSTGEQSFAEQTARGVEQSVYEDVPSAVADAVNEVSTEHAWIPKLVAQHVGPWLKFLGQDEPENPEELIPCNREEGDDEASCFNTQKFVNAEADRTTGRDWPFQFAACSEGSRAEHHPEFDRRAFSDQLVENPSARGDEDPLNAALGEFRAESDCRNPGRVLSSAVARAPELPELLDAVDAFEDVPEAPGAPSPQEVLAAAPQIGVGHSFARIDERLDPELGMVSEAESWTRNVRIVVPGSGAIDIAGVYARALSRAKGTPGTATTEYTRVLWGVRLTDADGVQRCDLCREDDEIDQIVEGMNRILGDRGRARLPNPEGYLEEGTPGGYQSGIQLDEFERINNFVVNGDGSYELAALELSLLNDSPTWGRQRQIFQFAGTNVNAQYGILCLAGGQAENGRCVLPPLEGGVLDVSLKDGDGAPLAGGQFSAAGPEQVECTTGLNGRCTMTDLEPGTYTISQRAAPSGYLSSEGLDLTVYPAEVTSAGFVNLRNAGRVEITLSDAAGGAPLPGGQFSVSQGGSAVASCTTDTAGRCTLSGTTDNELPLGDYVVQQTVAPAGYLGVPDQVPVTLELSGDVVNLDFTNGPDGSVAGTVVSRNTPGTANPRGFQPGTTYQTVADRGDTQGRGGPGGFLQDVFDEFRNFLLRSPGDAVLFMSTLGLLALPLWNSWRRRLLIEAAHQSTTEPLR